MWLPSNSEARTVKKSQEMWSCWLKKKKSQYKAPLKVIVTMHISNNFILEVWYIESRRNTVCTMIHAAWTFSMGQDSRAKYRTSVWHIHRSLGLTIVVVSKLQYPLQLSMGQAMTGKTISQLLRWIGSCSYFCCVPASSLSVCLQVDYIHISAHVPL